MGNVDGRYKYLYHQRAKTLWTCWYLTVLFVTIIKSNTYFFARPGCNSNLRACDCLREIAKEAKLQKPHLLRSTKMRKYTATVSQILNLKESQLDWLADHLGHIIQVHRDVYRLSSPTVELTKIAKLMLAVDGGNIGKFVGKSLDEIQLQGMELYMM